MIVKTDNSVEMWQLFQEGLPYYMKEMLISLLPIILFFFIFQIVSLHLHKKTLVKNYKEVNLFLRGIIPLIGFETSTVEYDRGERFAGKSKYPLKKMIYFAIDGITSTSVRPIRMITMFGLLCILFSIIYGIYVIIGHVAGGTVQGWTTSVLLICFFGGAQIMCTGIVGEYVGKIYLETKARPRFIIEEKLTDDSKNK